MPPQAVSVSRATGPKADGQARSSSEYAAQHNTATATQASPGLMRSCASLSQSPFSKIITTPASASATPSPCSAVKRSCSHSAEINAISTGATEYSSPMLTANVLRPPM